MITATLNLVRGDDQMVGVYVNQPDGTPYNLSGATLTFTARNGGYFSPIVLQKIVSGSGHFGAATGASSFNFTSGDTASLGTQYYYDIKMLSSGNLLTTLASGPFYLCPQ